MANVWIPVGGEGFLRHWPPDPNGQDQSTESYGAILFPDQGYKH